MQSQRQPARATIGGLERDKIEVKVSCPIGVSITEGYQKRARSIAHDLETVE
ncbi:MAG: hypothetical protein LUQ38_09015 [Methanotrichaceae archaeon]|nr:hypothetical protein [Methanotrichaceae archaeon]